jgi:hypothetical protein
MKLKAKCQIGKPWPRWEEQDKKDLIQKEGRKWEEIKEEEKGRVASMRGTHKNWEHLRKKPQ